MLKLDNGLTALLISDTHTKTKKSGLVKSDQQVDEVENKESCSETDSDGDDEMDSDDSDCHGDDSDNEDERRDKDVELSSKKKVIQRETKLVSILERLLEAGINGQFCNKVLGSK